MSELERDLTLLRDAVAWPQTPDVAAAVTARLAGSEATRPAAAPRWRAWLRRRRRLSVAALVAVVVGGVAVSPAGGALLRWFGIGSTIRVVELERLPLAAAGEGFGEPVTLARARLLADFALRVPGSPTRVRFSTAILGGAVTLEYPGATLTQFAGSSTAFLEKVIAPPTRARRVTVNGAPGVFLEGGPTQLFVSDRRGEPVTIGGVEPGTNVLLWESAGAGFRLETRDDLAGALRFARRLR